MKYDGPVGKVQIWILLQSRVFRGGVVFWNMKRSRSKGRLRGGNRTLDRSRAQGLFGERNLKSRIRIFETEKRQSWKPYPCLLQAKACFPFLRIWYFKRKQPFLLLLSQRIGFQFIHSKRTRTRLRNYVSKRIYTMKIVMAKSIFLLLFLIFRKSSIQEAFTLVNVQQSRKRKIRRRLKYFPFTIKTLI